MQTLHSVLAPVVAFSIATLFPAIGDAAEQAHLDAPTPTLKLLWPKPLGEFHERLGERFSERFTFSATNRLTPLWSLEFLLAEEKLRSEGTFLFDYRNDTGRRLASRGLTLALREYAVEEMPLLLWKEEGLDSILRFFRNTLSGREEYGQLASPFNPEEGLLSGNGLRHKSGLRFLLRPFRTSNPYAGLSYGKRNQDGELLFLLSGRYYYRDWEDHAGEIIAEVPLTPSWQLFGGARFRGVDVFSNGSTHGERIATYAFGIAGQIGAGALYVSAEVGTEQRLLCFYEVRW